MPGPAGVNRYQTLAEPCGSTSSGTQPSAGSLPAVVAPTVFRLSANGVDEMMTGAVQASLLGGVPQRRLNCRLVPVPIESPCFVTSKRYVVPDVTNRTIFESTPSLSS